MAKSKAQPTVELAGGPKSPKSWDKWAKDGGEALREIIRLALTDIGCSGEFTLRGIEGGRGSASAVGHLRLLSIRSAENAIELSAQPGSAESRWKYRLSVPHSIDVVDLHAQLEERISSDKQEGKIVTPADNDKEEQPTAASTVVEAASQSINGHHASDEVRSSNGLAALPDKELLIALMSKADAYTQAKELLNRGKAARREELQQEIMSAEEEVKQLTRKLDDLKAELELCDEEYGEAERVANDPAYAAAHKKIMAINEIIGSE